MTALSDPTRRAIVARLAEGPATVGELAEPLPMSQQAVSKHIAALERADLVRKERAGRRHICRLNPAPIREVRDWATTYQRLWEERLDRLDAYLQELQAQRPQEDSPDADAAP